MKLKNITDSVRELRDFGQVVSVKPGETVEVVSPIYNQDVFKVVTDIQKSVTRQLNKGGKYNGTSNRS